HPLRDDVMSKLSRIALVAALLLPALAPATTLEAQARAARMTPPSPTAVSELRDTVLVFGQDRGALLRRWTVPFSPDRASRLRAFYTDWRNRLQRIDFDRLS